MPDLKQICIFVLMACLLVKPFGAMRQKYVKFTFELQKHISQ